MAPKTPLLCQYSKIVAHTQRTDSAHNTLRRLCVLRSSVRCVRAALLVEAMTAYNVLGVYHWSVGTSYRGLSHPEVFHFNKSNDGHYYYYSNKVRKLTSY